MLSWQERTNSLTSNWYSPARTRASHQISTLIAAPNPTDLVDLYQSRSAIEGKLGQVDRVAPSLAAMHVDHFHAHPISLP